MVKCAIYMDHNASSAPLPGVAEAVAEAVTLGGNASSVHGCGRAAHALLEQARVAVQQLVDAPDGRVIFTSGATEANNMALGSSRFSTVVVSAIEHPSVLAVRKDALIIPVNDQGLVDLDALQAMLTKAKAGPDTLVSVMLANNETGVIQPIAEVAEMTHRFGALVHCDAVQAVGRVKVSMQEMGVDFMSVSGHKFGGPQGVGALVLGKGQNIQGLMGGGQERGFRAGTENLPGIAGMKKAVETIINGGVAIADVQGLRDAFEEKLLQACPGIQIFSSDVARLPNTSCFALKGLASETQVMALDLGGLAISAGSACSSGKVKASPVIKAMGFDEGYAESAVRVSFGPGNKDTDILRFFDLWQPLARRYQNDHISMKETAA